MWYTSYAIACTAYVLLLLFPEAALYVLAQAATLCFGPRYALKGWRVRR